MKKVDLVKEWQWMALGTNTQTKATATKLFSALPITH